MHVLDALERALIDFVWQGGAVALVVAGLLAMMSRRSAKGRYVVACLGLATMAVLPLVTFLRALMEGPAAAASLGLAPQALAPAAVAREVVVADLAPTAEVTMTWLELLRPWLLPAWCAGVLLLSARTLVSWYAAQRLSRLHTREPDSVWREAMERALAKLRMSRPVRLMASTRIDVPQVIGLWRPLILVPAGAITGLSPQQLEAVLSHELAHIQRHDYLVNLLQALVETFLFYHPAVWWLSHRIREEREHCADDQAVQSCGDAVLYARALAHIEQLRAPPSALLALGADGGSLLGRIRRLLSVPDTRAPRRSWRLVSGLGGAALAVALGSSQVPMTAMAVAPQALDVAPVAKHERAFTEVTPPVHRPLVAPAPRILPLDLTSKTPSRPTRVLHKVSTAPRKARESSPRPLLIPDTQGIARTQLPRTPYPLDVEPAVPSEAVAVESHETPVDEAPVDEAQVEHDSISMQVMAAALPALTPATTPPAAPTPPRPQPEDDGAFTLGPGITPPRFVSGQRLAFQDITQNLRSRISAVPKGSIVTRCTITAEGSVTNCKSLQSLSGLEEGVIRTLTTWRYEPATLDGKPVPVHYEFDIWFTNEPGGGRDQQLASADKPGKRADGSSQSACILCASVSASSVVTPPVAGF